MDARKERMKKSQTVVEKALREEIEGLEMRLREERKKGEVRGRMGKSINVFELGTTTSIGSDDG